MNESSEGILFQYTPFTQRNTHVNRLPLQKRHLVAKNEFAFSFRPTEKTNKWAGNMLMFHVDVRLISMIQSRLFLLRANNFIQGALSDLKLGGCTGRWEETTPLLWNGLPLYIRQCATLGEFKQHLKTYYFTVAFEQTWGRCWWWHWVLPVASLNLRFYLSLCAVMI